MSIQQLFNPQVFEQEFKKPASSISLFKNTLKEGNEFLNKQFDEGVAISKLLSDRAWLIDQILNKAWDVNIHNDKLSLVAVGGYGRGELYPGSDIDLMIIQPARIKAEIKSDIESFIRFLWDIGLEVGHSVRSVKDCIREAKSDITVATNIMESRLLAGRDDLYTDMKKFTGPNKIWKPRKFFESKHTEQIDRHQRYNDTDHNLEPNIKEGPGGLRDIQMIYWVAKRHFDVDKIQDLVDHGFLTRDEYKILNSGHDFLSKVRYALHYITGRREDRLLFDLQRKVAEKFSYTSEDNSAIENFMRRYYSTISELSRLNEMLLQHFEEAII